MAVNRVAPATVADPATTRALGDLANALDGARARQTFAIDYAATVSVAAGELRHLAPRAAGQNVVIPTADGSNFGQRIQLWVDASLGSCRVRPISGTINGAGAFTLATGYVSLIELVSNGKEGWATTRAGGFPAAGDGLDYSGDTLVVDASDFAGTGLEDDGSNNLRIAAAAAGNGLTGGGGSALAVGAGAGISVAADAVAVDKTADFDTTPWSGAHRFTGTHILVGTTFWRNRLDQTLAANANNVDVSGVNVLRLVGNGFTLTGMVAASDGQVVLIINADAGDALNIANESASSSAANRFTTPNAAIYSLPLKSAVWARYDGSNSRWYLIASPGNG